ncbi:MAG TPA: hypothetical protein VH207_13570 [Chthoniobacterales bacterium]|nr:hypothetical protein [Chthoniobacterales bacterium]
MKEITIKLSRNLLRIAVCLVVGLVLAGPESASGADKKAPSPAQTNQPAGRLVIVRSARLGPTVVALNIDGVETAKITYNRRYDAPLAAGEHVLTVYPMPSLEGARPTETKVNVQPGKTYTFTAARDDIQIVLK